MESNHHYTDYDHLENLRLITHIILLHVAARGTLRNTHMLIKQRYHGAFVVIR